MKIGFKTNLIVNLVPSEEEFNENKTTAAMLFANFAYKVAVNMKYGVLLPGKGWSKCKAAWLWYYYLHTVTLTDLELKPIVRQQYWNVVKQMSLLGNDYNWTLTNPPI